MTQQGGIPPDDELARGQHLTGDAQEAAGSVGPALRLGLKYGQKCRLRRGAPGDSGGGMGPPGEARKEKRGSRMAGAQAP